MNDKTVSRGAYKRRLVILTLLSFLCSAGPLLGIFLARREVYFSTVADTVKVGIGGVVLGILLLMKVCGKLGVPRRVVVYAVIFVLSYLLSAVLSDLILISGAALAGEAVDAIFLQGAIKRTREALVIEKTADATEERVRAVMEEYLGGRT